MSEPTDIARCVAPYETSRLDRSGIIQKERVPCYCLESTTRSRASYVFTSRVQSTH